MTFVLRSLKRCTVFASYIEQWSVIAHTSRRAEANKCYLGGDSVLITRILISGMWQINIPARRKRTARRQNGTDRCIVCCPSASDGVREVKWSEQKSGKVNKALTLKSVPRQLLIGEFHRRDKLWRWQIWKWKSLQECCRAREGQRKETEGSKESESEREIEREREWVKANGDKVGSNVIDIISSLHRVPLI